MTHRFLSGLIAAGLCAASALAQPAAPGAPGDDPQVLDHGPVHEAFADPLRYDASEDPVLVTQQPPEPVNELPPEYKPEGANVEWIPGYWMWDDTRDDFIWVSGVYRKLPPGQTWVVGYWSEAPGGYEWTPGFWTSAEQQNVQYLPYPPETLEQGPNSEAPGENYFWIPGCWQYRNNDYAWQAGYWYQGNANWVWTPSHYYYTPRGALYVNGYWDYPLASRGLLYAPVYWNSGYGVGYHYRPRNVLSTVGLLTSLFIGPRYSYYYGPSTYYASYNSYRPWHSAYNTRYGYYGNRGYDPLLAYYAWNFGRNQSGWQNRAHNHWNNDWNQWNQRDDRRGRRDNDFDRNNLVRSVEQLNRSNRNDFRLTRLDDGQLDRLSQQVGKYDQFRRQREQLEHDGDRRQFSQRDRKPGDAPGRGGERDARGRNAVDTTAQLDLPDWARQRGQASGQRGQTSGQQGVRERGNRASQQARNQQAQAEQQARSQRQSQAQQQAAQQATQQARAEADARRQRDQRRDPRTFSEQQSLSNRDGSDLRSRGNRELRAYRGPNASSQQAQQRAQQQRSQDQQREAQQRAQQLRELQQRSQPRNSQPSQPSFRGFRGGQSPSAAPPSNRSLPQSSTPSAARRLPSQSVPSIERRSTPQAQAQRSMQQRVQSQRVQSQRVQSQRVQSQPAPSRRSTPAPSAQRSRGPAGPPAAQQGGGNSFRGFRGNRGGKD